MKKTVKVLAFLALLTTCVYAQEKDSSRVNQLSEVVVSDTKFAQHREKSGKVIEVISSEDLVKKTGQSLANVLSQVAGVEINGNQSATGKNLGYYIRGGKNRQVLIIIDGIPVTDASGISIEYDLRMLPVEQIERIEIMKGASSTLYGTGAAAGVINITLKKSSKKAIQGNAYMNIGSNNTAENHKYNGQDFNQGISVNGGTKKINYFAGFNSTVTGGMSQIAEPMPTDNYEKDRFFRNNIMTKLGVKASDKLTLDFFANYDKINNDYDGTFDNTGTNDTDVNKTASEQVRFGVSPKYTYAKGEFILNSGFTTITRDYYELNSYTNGVDYSLYKSRNVILDGYNKYNFNEKSSLILGVNYQFYDMLSETPYGNIANSNTKFNILDGYTTFVYHASSGLNVNAGARLNNHSAYGNQLVWNFNPSYNFKTDFPLKAIASYSTAFVTPSLYQLYSEYGNPNLTPEKDATIEVGFETELWSKKVLLNTVAFYRDQKNTIDFYFNDITYDAFYININGTNKAKGIETSVNYVVNSKLKMNANYTFTHVDEALNRLIPKHKVNASVDFQFNPRVFLGLSYQYLDSRKDIYFDGNSYEITKVNLNAYQLVNVTAKYEVIKNRMTIFGNATNIFNEKFVENVGYSTRGRNFKIGLNVIL